jgi:glycerol-3-phosphate cytidylyltransferase
LGDNVDGRLFLLNNDTLNYENRITFSAFDLLHAGHVKMLEDAKRQCDYLIAALQTDPPLTAQRKNRPTQSVVERYIQLKGCVYG